MSTHSKKPQADDLPSVGNLLQYLDDLHLEHDGSDDEILHEGPKPVRDDIRGIKEVTLHTDVAFGASGLSRTFHPKKV
jgi:hypothetical protein